MPCVPNSHSSLQLFTCDFLCPREPFTVEPFGNLLAFGVGDFSFRVWFECVCYVAYLLSFDPPPHPCLSLSISLAIPILLCSAFLLSAFIHLGSPYILIGSHFLCLLTLLAVLWLQPQQAASTYRARRGGIGGSAPPGCCHSSAWFHIGVLLVVESGTGEAVSTVASGTAWHFWVCCHFPAFVFKKRLGCQLVFVQSPLQPSPQRQRSRITLEFRL